MEWFLMGFKITDLTNLTNLTDLTDLTHLDGYQDNPHS